VLRKLVDEHGTTDAATGMARNSDQEFGWSALFAGMALHAHIPFLEQAARWPAEDQAAYRRILERCTTRTVYGPSYDVKWLFARNDGLLNFVGERAGVVAAVWDPRRRKGGTFDTVQKAAARGLPVIHFDAARLQVHGPGCSCVTSLTKQRLMVRRSSRCKRLAGRNRLGGVRSDGTRDRLHGRLGGRRQGVETRQRAPTRDQRYISGRFSRRNSSSVSTACYSRRSMWSAASRIRL
jgi:hypothetical protein